MFKTIKSRIFLIILSTLFALIIIFSIFSYAYFQNSRQVFIDASYLSISTLIQSINTDIAQMEDNARDMATFGEIFYISDKKQDTLDKFVLKSIGDYSQSISGGIWFEPYIISPNKKHFSSFVFLDEQNKMSLNENYQNENNSYLKSVWYQDLFKQLSDGKEIAWSAPYYEYNGSKSYMITAGVGIYNDGKLIGISTADWGINSIINDISQVKPTPNSFLLFADINKDFILVSTDSYLNNSELFGKSLKNIPWYHQNLENKRRFMYHNKRYIQYVNKLNNDLVLIANVPENELYSLIMIRFKGAMLILLFFSIILCSSIYSALNKNIIIPINKLINLADKIGHGETDLSIKIEKPEEFAKLASSFDEMTENLKNVMAKQAVIESELLIARSIQTTSLPSIFPPFPERGEFDIYATMMPAKEVGGDFYDFYFISPNRFMFLIADVSGKGIPAALFMMTVKTLINNLSQTIYSPDELAEAINKKICSSTKEGFFVTLFACIVDVNTGEVDCINCGHNPPLIRNKDGKYKFLELPSNIVLGAFPESKFEIHKLKLNSGDRLFLYTDGVTEAFNSDGVMYGEEALQKTLNQNPDLSLSETLNKVYTSVNEHISNIQRSDDITMLAFDYKGLQDKKVFKKNATKENYQKYFQMLYGAITQWNLDEELANKIYMCAEEVYANVLRHAYKQEGGYFESELEISGNEITLICMDKGEKYNPLERQDPDITLPPEQRQAGGLGIFMIKRIADEILYEYKDDKNILILKFKK